MPRTALPTFVLLTAAAICQTTPEPIPSPYQNMRGFNYIATYPAGDMHTLLGVPTSISLTDVASAPAMWRGYDPAGATGSLVRQQLQRIKDVGANTVRVWLSYHLYHWHPAEMTSKFNAFLTECDTIGLNVMPILWDNDFQEPDYSSFAGNGHINMLHWIRSPGIAVLEYHQGALSQKMTSYVTDMVNTGRSHVSLLMWNVMNEPVFGPKTYQDEFVINNINLIEQLDSQAVISVSPALWSRTVTEYSNVANAQHLDVMGTHLYGYGKRDIEGLCDNARLLNAAKPIVVTEAGFTGQGNAYIDAMNLLSKVPASITGYGSDGVGFCLFQAYVGNLPINNLGNHPYVTGDGLLYSPHWDTTTGFARDYTNPTVISTMIALAGQHGVTVPAPNIVPMPNNWSMGYVPHYPLPEWWQRTHFDYMFTNVYPEFTDEQVLLQTGEALTYITVFSLKASLSYASTPITAQHAQQITDAFIYYHETWLPDPNRSLSDPLLQSHFSTWYVLVAHYWTTHGFGALY